MAHWINEAEHAESYFSNSIPPKIFNLGHLPINYEVIYTDLLAATPSELGQVYYLFYNGLIIPPGYLLNHSMLFQSIPTQESVGLTNAAGFKEIIQKNRAVVNAVPQWITAEERANAIFAYGIPDSIFEQIDLPLNNEWVYTDLIVAAAAKLDNIHYLELGVSVGKNALPVARALQQSRLLLWDIENPPPVLRQHFKNWALKNSWPAPEGSMRQADGQQFTFSCGTNTGQYIAADILLEKNWQRLKGTRCNLIFSDAFHSPAAILHEYEMLRKFDIISNRFVLFFDDLHANMLPAFHHIARQMARQFPFSRIYKHLVTVNGWIGQHETLKHPIGILTNINLNG